MRLLLIEDSRRLQRSLVTGLKREGYSVDATGDGEAGLWFAENHDYDCIILDLMLPGLDGMALLERLREQGRETHVLILSAKDTVADRVRGLQTGADDYLVKPFAFEELLARLQALIRRGYGSKTNRITIGALTIDTAGRVVTKAGETIDLPPREYALLELLARKRGTVVSRTEIEEHIYDDKVEPMSNVVDSAMSSLRRLIDGTARESLIRTRRGMGYIIE